MKSDKAFGDLGTSQAELQAILERDSWIVVRGDRGTVLALVPKGLSPQGWGRLSGFVQDLLRTFPQGGSHENAQKH